jgi:hypothetical protein
MHVYPAPKQTPSIGTCDPRDCSAIYEIGQAGVNNKFVK